MCATLRKQLVHNWVLQPKEKHDASKRRLTGASGAEALALSFEMLVTLLGLVPSSISRGVLRLLSGHHRHETGHLCL